MEKSLLARIGRRVLPWIIGCWVTVAGASEVLVPEFDTPAPVGSGQQQLHRTAEGRLLLSWAEKGEQASRLQFAILEKQGWSTPRTVVTVRRDLAAASVMLSLSDGVLMAAWMVRGDHRDSAG